MELFCWLSTVTPTPKGLLLEQGAGHVTMKPHPQAYASVGQLRAGTLPGKLLSATALLQLVAGPERRFVLLRRDADAPVDPLRWQFPAGRCSPFENPVDTAMRELLEEVSLESGAGIGLSAAQPQAIADNTEHELVGPDGFRVRFSAPYREVANTFEFFVPLVLTLPTLEGLRLTDNEDYGRLVQAFSLDEVLTLAQEGSLTAAATAILAAARELKIF